MSLDAIQLTIGAALVGMVAVLFSVMCRLEHMSRRTRRSVRAYFLTITAGMVASATVLVVAPFDLLFRLAAALTIVVAAVLAGLLISAHRWRDAAPPDTTRPPLDRDEL